jgi:integrase
MRVEDVDISSRVLRIVARRRLKTLASEAEIPIAPELAAILQTWIPRTGSEWLFPGVRRFGPWTGGKCGERACDRLRQAGEAVEVSGFTLQSLRHTFATHARRRWGISELELADILRHTSPRTQQLYIRPDPDPGSLNRAVQRVSYS